MYKCSIESDESTAGSKWYHWYLVGTTETRNTWTKSGCILEAEWALQIGWTSGNKNGEFNNDSNA